MTTPDGDTETQAPVALERRASGATLVLRGTVDVRCAGDLRQLALRALAATEPVAVDWSDAEHLDTAALQVLVALRAACVRAARPFAPGAPSERVAEILRVVGLAGVLTPSDPTSSPHEEAPSRG